MGFFRWFFCFFLVFWGFFGWVFLDGFFIANPDLFLSGQLCCRWAGTASAGWTGTAFAACASCAGSTLRTTRYQPSGDRPSRISGRGRRAMPFLISLKSLLKPLNADILHSGFGPRIIDFASEKFRLPFHIFKQQSGFGMNIPESVYKYFWAWAFINVWATHSIFLGLALSFFRNVLSNA